MSKKKFVDLQVNGYLGVDYSSSLLTDKDFVEASKKMSEDGDCVFLPTIITSSEQLYERNLKLISSLIKSEGLKSIMPGIHIEGPFISREPGAVGAHNPDWVKESDLAFLDKLQVWARGKIKLMTIAAEISGAEQLCKHAVSMGIAVSLGHQLATADDMKRLSQAGATMLTHLGNGIPNLVHRHNNQILAGLSIPELKAMIITDGHHLPDHVISAIINAKGVDGVIVTSDASPIAGMKPGNYNVLGNDAVLEESGLLHNPEKQCLVGSSANIRDCVEYLNSRKIVAVEESWRMSSVNPGRVINMPSAKKE